MILGALFFTLGILAWVIAYTLGIAEPRGWWPFR